MGYSTTTAIVSQHPPSHDAEYECSLEAIFGTPEYTSRRGSSGSGSNTTSRWGNGSNSNNDLLPSASTSSSSHSFDSSTVSLKWEDSVDSFCSFEETDDEEEPELVYHQRKSRYHAPAATKQVQFDCVQIREYALTVGDHPWCPSCPLSLSWEHTPARRVNLDAFEFDKRNRREAEQLFRHEEEDSDDSDGDYPRELTLRQRRQRLATVLGSRRLAQQLEVRAARKSVLEELKQFLLILDDDEDEEDEHDTIFVQAQEHDWWMQRECNSASSTVVTSTARPLFRSSAGANEIGDEPHRYTRKSQQEEAAEESCSSHDECASLVEASKEAKEHSYNNNASKQSGTTLMSVFGGMMSRSPFRRSRRHQGYQQLLAEQ